MIRLRDSQALVPEPLQCLIAEHHQIADSVSVSDLRCRESAVVEDQVGDQDTLLPQHICIVGGLTHAHQYGRVVTLQVLPAVCIMTN